MIFKTIWERYFLKELLKVFTLFIVCFYGLYVLIDYSNHAGAFHAHHHHIQWKVIAVYYGSEFIRRLEVLIPFALIIATVKTLCNLTVHNELVALMGSGVKLRTLMRPFLFISLFFTALLYLNIQLFQPQAISKLKELETQRAIAKRKYQRESLVQHLKLVDGSVVIFQDFEEEKKRFYDVFWIKNFDEIYRIKYLYPSENPPRGEVVEQLIRSDKGDISLAHKHENYLFENMSFDRKVLQDTMVAFEELPISALWEKVPTDQKNLTEKQSQILSIFYYKAMIPWLCLMSVIGPAPYCTRFTRQLPVFFIYAGSIFGLVFLYLFFDALVVLGKRQVIDPTWGFFSFFITVFTFFTWKFLTLDRA